MTSQVRNEWIARVVFLAFGALILYAWLGAMLKG